MYLINRVVSCWYIHFKFFRLSPDAKYKQADMSLRIFSDKVNRYANVYITLQSPPWYGPFEYKIYFGTSGIP